MATAPTGPETLVVLSARTPRTLDAAAADVAARLRRLPEADLAAAAYTLATGRRAHRHRRAVLCHDPGEAARLLEEPPSDGHTGAVAVDGPGSLVFELPGDVPDVERLAAEAARAHPRFATYHQSCRRAGAFRHGGRGAVFAFEYAMARLWLHWGLRPRAIHASGVGEIAAACVSGALGLAKSVALLDGAKPPADGRTRSFRIPVESLDQAGPEAGDVALRAGGGSPLEALRQAWLAGAQVDWENVYDGQERRRIRLPARPAASQPRSAGSPRGGRGAPAAAHRGAGADGAGTDGAEVLPWVLSASSAAALKARAAELSSAAEREPGRSPLDLGRSLVAENAAAAGSVHRAVVLGRDREDFLRGLTALCSDRPAAGMIRGTASVSDGRIVLVFPGQGTQWQGMAADLLESCPAFREEAEACVEAFAPHLDWSLTDLLHDRPGAASLQRVDVVQPALFTIMVSLAALLRSWGVRPDAVIGHSLGEVAAAYVCGALSLQDAATVAAQWSKAQATLVGAGDMASVELPAEALRDRLAGYDGRLGLAAVNGPDWVLVSGGQQDVAQLVEELTAEGVRARLINVGLAAHSAHIDAITDRMTRDLASLTPRPARVPFRSSVTGELLNGTELDAAYWCRNLRGTVEFARTVRAQVEAGYRTFLELSPHPALTMGVTNTLEAADAEFDSVVMGSLRRDRDGRTALLSALAGLYVRGVPVDWAGPLGGTPASAPTAVTAAAAAPVPADRAEEPEDEDTGPLGRLAGMPEAAAERMVLELIGSHVAALLGVGSPDEVAPSWAGRSLGALGFTSLLAVDLRDRLTQDTGLRLPRTLVFDHPVPRALARFLAGELRDAPAGTAPGRPAPEAAAPATAVSADAASPAAVPQAAEPPAAAGLPDGAIAIVGLAARLPGARDLEEYWDLLSGGREAIARFDDEELAAAGVPEELIRDPAYVKAFGALHDAEMFDAAFFGLTPAEAELTDPQHRLFLQTCHAALEHAGCDAARHPGTISVFGGAANNAYLQHNVLGATDQSTTSQYFRVLFGNDKDYLATRVAYKLDLKGPSYTVQTACSTSLVALHLACQALRAGECDLALAGGVSVRIPEAKGHLYEEGAILSADGQVRAFDADASGTVFGNGAGVLALKRLTDAVADGDTVHAVIRGVATNNDGAGKVSYAAPARDGQAEVVAKAQAAAGTDARTITYVEAHGTGTTLGDPVEVAALTQAFRHTTQDNGYCAIGSVKPNIGHLDAASGVAGVIKVVLMMRHRTIVPSINFQRPNPAIDFEDTPFRVADELRPWPANGSPRRAGVSSFGVGGTNAHAVLEEAPPREPSGPSRPEQLLLLSAATPSALDRAAARLAGHLRRDTGVPLADVAYTLAVGRTAHRFRLGLLCRDTDEAVTLLEDRAARESHTAQTGYAPPAAAFAFPALDGPDERQCAELAAAEPAFAEAYEACAAAGALGHGPRGLAFTYQYALAGLWEDWGLRPETFFAEGAGELVAHCRAGALRLDEAIRALAASGGSGTAPARRAPRLPVLPYAQAEAAAGAGVVLVAGHGSAPAALRDAWLRGAEVDWERFHRGQRRHRVPLPTYPFEGRRHWLEPTAPAPAGSGEPGPRLRTVPDPAGSGRACAEVTLTTAEPFLADHTVAGAAVLPAAVHLELARAAGEAAVGAKIGVLRDVAFERMLSFRGGARTLRVVLEPHGGARSFTVTADGAPDAEDGEDGEDAEDGAGAEAVYSRGELLVMDSAGASTADAPRRLGLDALRRRCPSRAEPATCYGLLRERGVRHGPSLRALREFAHRAGHEAVGVLDLADTGAATPDGGFGPSGAFVLPPALLDGALQVAACLLAASGEDDGAAYLPIRLGALHLHADLTGRCTVHVTRSSGGPGDQVVRFDLALAHDDGTVAVHLTDLVLRRLPAGAGTPAAAPRQEAVGGPAPVFLRGHWEAAPLGPAAGAPGGPFLLLADADAEAARRALEQALRDTGEPDTPVVLVTPGPAFRRDDARTYRVAPERPDDFTGLMAALAADGITPRRILHAWSRPAPPADAFGTGLIDLGVGSLFHLTKALLGRRPVAAVRLLFAHPLGAVPGGPDQAVPVHEAVAAFARTARLENPALEYRVAALAPDTLTAQLPVLLREFGTDTGREAEVRYERDQRLVRRYRPVDPPAQDTGGAALRNGGVYLITGGGGGIGLLLAEHLARRVRANLVLVGRSEPDPGTRARLEAIAAAGGSARYLRADVSREDDVRAVLAAVEADHGTLNGVVHAAGVLRDSFLAAKSPQDLSAVLAPKVHGTVHLDRLTAHHPLDFFAAFSSVAAPLGNVGQADYAYANAFMDAALAHRERLVADGRRNGRSVSIAWPLWRDGGMAPDEASAAELERRLGSAALPAPVGLTAFETALTLPGGAVLVALGDTGTVQAALSPAESPAARPRTAEPDVPQAPAARSEAAADPRAVAENLLRETLAARTKLDPAAMDAQAPLDRYGIDSLLIVRLNGDLEETFGELSKTLFFEYTTLAELAGYFADHHADRLRELAPVDRPEPAPAAPAPREQAPAVPAPAVPARADGADGADGHPVDEDEDAIAVIGLSGRYPMAADLGEFWQNLESGRDCVTEIPGDRWDHSRYFEDGPPAPGRASTKWGGFLDDVDRFDPLFFGISPREAELMDPQERMFLQTAWHAVEDAGYRRADLAGRQVGVFAAAMYAEYQLFGAAALAHGDGPVAASLHASIANRVSYVLDLRGPSLAVDTMCSSSLTAIQLACQSLRGGDSELAIAGGVNLSLHPHKYVYLSQGRFVSADGRCRSFGADGTGYVPGEGVGAVLLKPLRRALADGDHIHGVILGEAVNHGGRTNGYTVPSPHAQQRVIEQAMRRARTSPRDIGYVEAHGTGTSLGDPIEITGLRKAYEALQREQGADGDLPHLPIGSLKSNVGHLEAAAGIAGLTKVLLQFRHGRLVPSLHSQRLNPNIDFAGSPFRVQRELAEWEPQTGDGGAPGPRRAALSSFGAGGSNAHLVLAEPPRTGAQDAAAVPAAEQRTSEPLLYVLSAWDEERLREYAGRLGRFLHTARVALPDVAHTLRCGREPMAERLAVVGAEGPAVARALLAFAEGAAAPAGLWHGRAGAAATADPAAADTGPAALARRWIAGEDPGDEAWGGGGGPPGRPRGRRPPARARRPPPRAPGEGGGP
ncbi:SDR family NAD(P)-dependent oxidoreductase, partial [Streptomyces sp. NPDC007983]|uniref:SDR family NAD(P)-dependent oxidoreductase n=1 Tax=Streptomyces sp. NPDC007983 TaxID=3364800 RepID=UPI0036E661E4